MSHDFSALVSYRLNFEESNAAVLIDLPVNWVRNGESDSLSGSLGIGVRLPVTDWWSITPAIRAGVAGSVDLGAAAVIYSGSVTSDTNSKELRRQAEGFRAPLLGRVAT